MEGHVPMSIESHLLHLQKIKSKTCFHSWIRQWWQILV